MERDKQASIVRRSNEGEYDPQRHIFDQTFSFLICEKLDFNQIRFDELYDESIEYRHRHNIILSIEDGVALYRLGDNQPSGGIHVYPEINGVKLKTGIMKPETGGWDYFKIFAHYFFLATSEATILYPDISEYMNYPGQEFGKSIITQPPP